MKPAPRLAHVRRNTRARLLLAALLAGTALVGTGPSAGAAPAAVSPAQVSVDFGDPEGEQARPEKYNNFGNVTAWPEQRADDVAFLNDQGLHGDIYRVWLTSPNAAAEDNLFNTCDLATRRCDFSRLDPYLSQASTVSDAVLVNLNPTDFVHAKRPYKDLKPLLTLMISSLKEQYPRVKYVEAFNEPDWQFHGLERRSGTPADETTLQPDGLYRYYKPFYQAVHGVNRKQRHGERIRLGGPALMFQDRTWLEPFLDAYAADRDPRKRLDFLSYHAYLSWDDEYKVPTLYSSDLSRVASERSTLRALLAERRLPRDLPAFVTETGIYPGPAFDDPDPRKDYVRQAAGMATYSYWYANQSDTYMFNWCVRHRVEERKDQLVTRTEQGPQLRTFTPYGNMLLMQSRMKDVRVSATSDSLEGDNGVYAMAAKDRTGASLMVWNWQHIHDKTYRATIDMARLPAELRRGPVRQSVYRIDATTSNHFADPSKASLQLVEQTTKRLGKNHRVTAGLAPNAIYLILLEPARS